MDDSGGGGRSGGDGDAVEHDGLDGEARAEAEEDAPVEPLAGGGLAVLGGALAHLVQDEEHAGAGHVAVLGEDVAGGAHPGLVQPDPGLHLVQDGGPAGVRHPEDGVPVGDAERLERVLQRALDVLGDEPGHVLEQVERQPHLAEVAVDGALRVGQDGLRRRHELEQRALDPPVRVGAHHDGRRAVAEQRLPHERVQVRLGRPAERHGRDLRAHHQDPRPAVVLRQVLGHAQHRAAREAPLLVHHQAVHGRAQPQRLGQLVVGARHVHPRRGAEHQVRDPRLGLPPLLDRLLRRRLPQLRHLRHHHVLPRVQRRRHVRAHARVLRQELLRQVHVPLPDHRLVAHPLELLLEVGEVVALGDPEVVVRVVGLVHAVGGRRRPDGQHGGGAGRALALPHLVHGHGGAGHRSSLFLSYVVPEAAGRGRRSKRELVVVGGALSR
uniref:Uncharacterized protein n=1 Tax=Zea mays TaxID=4577 RepID=C0HFI4_MAIZE|nr:unknown [Zea mays]